MTRINGLFYIFLNYLFLNSSIRVDPFWFLYCTVTWFFILQLLYRTIEYKVQSTKQTTAVVGIGIAARLHCLNPEPLVVVSDSDFEPLLVLPIPPHGLPIVIETAVYDHYDHHHLREYH